MDHRNRANCGLAQLGAILNKNAIEKRRNIRITFCEFVSHMIIISFLVFGLVISFLSYFHLD